MINNLYSVFAYDQNVPLPSCFGEFLSVTGDDLLPFSIGASTVGSAAGDALSRTPWAPALEGVAQMPQRAARGVFKDGRFQRLLMISAELEISAPLFDLGSAEGRGLWSEWNLMRSGGCQ